MSLFPSHVTFVEIWSSASDEAEELSPGRAARDPRVRNVMRGVRGGGGNINKDQLGRSPANVEMIIFRMNSVSNNSWRNVGDKIDGGTQSRFLELSKNVLEKPELLETGRV